MRGRWLVALVVLVLAGYLALIGFQGGALLSGHSLTVAAMGAAVLVLCVLGVWAVLAELRFGAASSRLARSLAADGEHEPELPRRPSGRVERHAADELFAQRRAELQAAPEDWRCWYRLARSYDYAGDRRRARAAMRAAIQRAERAGAAEAG